jgi:hypothetical protein
MMLAWLSASLKTLSPGAGERGNDPGVRLIAGVEDERRLGAL